MIENLALDFRRPLFFGAAAANKLAARQTWFLTPPPLSLRIQLTRGMSSTRALPTARCSCLYAIGFICYEFIVQNRNFFLETAKTPDTFMPRQISEPFFSKHPVFCRNEYAPRAPPQGKTFKMLFTFSAGNVKRVGRDVFASVPKHVDAQKWVVDRFLAASRLQQNGVIAYHSALELHGYDYSEGLWFRLFQSGSPDWSKPRALPVGFSALPKDSPEILAPWSGGVTTVNRFKDVAVTTIEQTIVHSFDRYDLVGGAEELFNSLDFVDRVDVSSLGMHAPASILRRLARLVSGWSVNEIY